MDGLYDPSALPDPRFEIEQWTVVLNFYKSI